MVVHIGLLELPLLGAGGVVRVGGVAVLDLPEEAQWTTEKEKKKSQQWD